METIDLHGLSLEEAETRLEQGLTSAYQYGEMIVRIIHGQGKHSEYFPVIKSFVRKWLRESEFSKEYIESIFYGEDGSPYTRPNPGETIVLFIGANETVGYAEEINWEEEEDWEARKHAKGRRADRLRVARRRNSYR